MNTLKYITTNMQNYHTLDEIGLRYHSIHHHNSKIVCQDKQLSTPRGGSNVKNKYNGGDKLSIGQNFTSFYHELMSSLRDKKINLMEIGIFNGKSIAMWADYFPNGTIYAIDINLIIFVSNLSKLRKKGAFEDKKLTYIYADQCELYKSCFVPDSDIKIIKCDTLSANFDALINHLCQLDIIIDDGNHNASSQWRNFEMLFDKIVEGGMYIIEDIIDEDEFFSAEYFGALIIGSFEATLLADNLKNTYINNMLNKNKIKLEKALEKVEKMNQHLVAAMNSTSGKPHDGLQNNLRIKIDEVEYIKLETKEIIEKKFDDFILVKEQFSKKILRAEIRLNNVIFFKK